MRTLRELVPAITRAGRTRTIPLLVVRLPEFAETAWREGTRAARVLERDTMRAFRAAAAELVRRDDVLAHDRGSDRFLIAMLDAGRDGASPSASDCRVMLDRLTARIAARTGRRMESGWWTIARASTVRQLENAVASALERGKRERERYAFLAAVGHELRTPLASIRGYLETVLEEGAGAAESRGFLETARRETLRLSRMVDGMLEFSLLELSPPSLATAACELVACARRAVETLLPLAKARRVRLRVDAAGPIAACVEPDACMHALLNLVENAVRYGREGGTVTISCASGAETAEIRVDDEGDGFDGRVRGHGLGLTIARTIAERAHGCMDLVRSPLGGTRAVLRFPAHALREAERRRTPS